MNHFMKLGAAAMIAIANSSMAADSGRQTLLNYCKADKIFEAKLVEEQILDSVVKSQKNVAFSALAYAISRVDRGGLTTRLIKSKGGKSSQPCTLSLEKRKDTYGFMIEVHDGYNFGDVYFSMMQQVIIAKYLIDSIESKALTADVDYDNFLIMYNSHDYNSTVIIKNGINDYYADWIHVENVKLNYWLNRDKSIDAIIRMNSTEENQLKISNLYQSLNDYIVSARS